MRSSRAFVAMAVVLAGIGLAPPFRQATTQKPVSSGIEIAGRAVRCGNVRILTDRHLPSEGAAAPGLLILNPRMLRLAMQFKF